MVADDHYQALTSGDLLGEDRQELSNFFIENELAHKLSEGISKEKTSGQSNLRTWKRLSCLVNSRDQIMHVLSCNGKRFGTCNEDVQPDLRSKKL